MSSGTRNTIRALRDTKTSSEWWRAGCEFKHAAVRSRSPARSCLFSAVLLAYALPFTAPFANGGAAQAAASADAEVRFAFDPDIGLILVPLAVDGLRATFVLDTGCTTSTFDKLYRGSLGRAVGTATMHMPDGDSAKVELFKPPPTTTGAINLAGLAEVLCVDLSPMRAWTGVNIDGIIGMDFLIERLVRIDFDNGEIVFLRSVPEGSGTSVPLRRTLTGIPTAALSVGGLGRRSFRVDTGKSGGLSMDGRSLDALLEEGTAVMRRGVLNVGLLRNSTRRSIRVREVALDNFRHSGLRVTECGDGNDLGLEYLSRYVVTFDFPRLKMYLKPGRKFAEPDRDNLSGLMVSRDKGVTKVDSVREASAASRAGIETGDVIELLDAVHAASIRLMKVRRIFCTPGKHTVRLVRNGQRVDAVLVLEEPLDPWQSLDAKRETASGQAGLRKGVGPRAAETREYDR